MTKTKPKCPIDGEYCALHEFVHGVEAEELRYGIERIIRDASDEADNILGALQKLIDTVDARDSVAWLEREGRLSRRGEVGK